MKSGNKIDQMAIKMKKNVLFISDFIESFRFNTTNLNVSREYFKNKSFFYFHLVQYDVLL